MHASTTRELLALVNAVHEAGLDPTGAAWPAVLDRVSTLVAGDGPVVLAVQHRQYEYAHTHYVRTEPADAARFQAYYARIDPVLEPLLPRVAPGTLLLTESLMPARALHRTEFYADWLRPLGIGAGAAAVLLRRGSAQVHLFAVRPQQRGSFVGDQLEALTLLLPHLAAAVATTLRLAEMGAASNVFANLGGRSAQSVILVDHAARVWAANPAAERLLAAADGLAVEAVRVSGRGGLRAATPAATGALRRLVAAAAVVAAPAAGVDRADAALTSGGGFLTLPRRSGQPPLAAHVAPLAVGAIAGAHWLQPLAPDVGHASAVVFVTDPTANDPATNATARACLRAVYGLTPAEADVAVAVAQGDGLAAVAAAHHVALATVRTQAQCVYRKTGARGQVGLARLVERLGRLG